MRAQKSRSKTKVAALERECPRASRLPAVIRLSTPLNHRSSTAPVDGLAQRDAVAVAWTSCTSSSAMRSSRAELSLKLAPRWIGGFTGVSFGPAARPS